MDHLPGGVLYYRRDLTEKQEASRAAVNRDPK